MAIERGESDIQWLNEIRANEFDAIMEFLPAAKESKVLEIGSGTGFLLNKLGELYTSVQGIEVETSAYNISDDRVSMYDGKNIRFDDSSFDVIFSCHVIEHVEDLDYLGNEIRRVLKPGGTVIHIAPSSTWRFFTSLFHYLHLISLPLKIFLKRDKTVSQRSSANYPSLKDKALYVLMAPRHGLTGNRITEIFYFSQNYWLKKFRAEGFSNIKVFGSGLIYWGHDVIRSNFSMKYRKPLSRVFGSSSNIFILKSEKEVKDL